MSLIDKLKGRTKKAAGDLIDDPDLRRQGRLDERKARAKEDLALADERAEREAKRVARLERQGARTRR